MSGSCATTGAKNGETCTALAPLAGGPKVTRSLKTGLWEVTWSASRRYLSGHTIFSFDRSVAWNGS